MTGSTALYFHIPFCQKKCPYCHFFVMANVDKHRKSFLEAVKKEWLLKQPELQGKIVESIYFGGGTPTEIGSDGIALLLKMVKKEATLSQECEITVETNPENVNASLIKGLKEAGVNRLSMGVQSLDDSSLLSIGRLHSASRAEQAIWCAFENGMTNITIDLMYDLPSQTLHSFQKTLQKLPSLPICHLSLYNLVVEEPSAFFRKKEEVESKMPTSEESLLMLNQAIQTADMMGLKRYEISAFAKPGYESRHNMRYWQGGEFLGLGPSAFSYQEGSRFQNVANLKQYYKELECGKIPISFEEKLDYPHNEQELIAIALRLLKGVHKKRIPKHLEKVIHQLCEENYLSESFEHVHLTEKGTLFYDNVASAII